MASKSKDVRMEQLRIFEKKLVLRLEQLAKKGISKEKALTDSLVKSLKSKIRETNVRIKALEKFIQLNQKLAQDKVQKLADLVAKKDEKPEPVESKSKKKEAGADKEPKKQVVAKDEATPKKPKKQPAEGDEAAPKKRTSKKKAEE
jgi:hypothetical protein